MKIDNSKIIFLHPGKTGGTSVEHTLRDLYIPDEKLIAKEPNFDIMFGFDKKYQIYLQHADIRFYINQLKCDLAKFKTITTVRRPYERLLSAFYYNGKSEKMSFEDFVINHLHKYIEANNKYAVNHFCPQIHYVKNQSYIVDYIIKLENFAEDCKRAGLNNVKYHYAKTISVHKYKNRLSAFTYKMKDIVYSLYKEDFELLDYKP
jgi:hypothetical protein